jgi:hypothetical protein
VEWATVRWVVSSPAPLHGSVSLDADRLGRDAGRTAEEIVPHPSTQKDAHVRLALEIEAELPHGGPDTTVRAVERRPPPDVQEPRLREGVKRA